MDREGRLIAGTSTGGTCCKLPGRVGDSPLIGCGCYADAEAGGVSCTGWGEAIMKIVMAKAAADLLRGCAIADEASGMRAAREAVKVLAERGRGTGGLTSTSTLLCNITPNGITHNGIISPDDLLLCW